MADALSQLLPLLPQILFDRHAEAATDADLLRRAIDEREEAAFETIVRRHGPMVFNVCRSVLLNEADAEDAFQVTFLILARNAKAVRKSSSLASWLYGVASRVARKARARSARRQEREGRLPPRTVADADQLTWTELRTILSEELAQLPECYQGPLSLCYLQGMTQDETARLLGLSKGTLKRRLESGRARLRERLVRRGFGPATVLLLAAWPVALASASVPPALVRSTVQAAVVTGVVPVRLATFTEGGLKTGPFAHLKYALVVVVLGAAVLIGAGVALRQSSATDPPKVDPPRSADPPVATAPQAPVDRFGDPLPAGALVRFGTVRWRHEGNAGAMAFSPDGATLAVICRNDMHIYLFDGATGVVRDRLAPPDGAGFLDALAFSPDGTVLAAQDRDCTVHLWNTRTKKLTRSLRLTNGLSAGGHEKSIRFSPDGKFLAAASGVFVGGAVGVTEHVVIWDVARGQPVVKLEKAGLANPPLAFSPDGKTVVLGTALDPAVQFWDVGTGKFLRGFNPDHSHTAAVTFSPDGKAIASCGGVRVVLTDATSGKELGRLEVKGTALKDLTFARDGSTLITSGSDGKVRVWDVATRKERFALNGPAHEGLSVALSVDGRTVAAGARHTLIRVWDVQTGKLRFPEIDGHDATVHAVAFSPDGRHIVTGGENGRVRLWDAVAGREERRFDGADGWGVAFSPDGRRLAVASGWSDSVRLWDLARKADPIMLRHPKAGIVRGTAFSPDGKTVLTAGWSAPADGGHSKKGPATLRLWNPETGKLARELAMPEIVPNAIATSADGRRVAVAGYSDSPLRLWDFDRDYERRLWSGSGDTVLATAFSPDGRVLAAGGDDRQPRVFETETGKEVLQLGRHERWVSAVAFAPGGRVLATADGGWQGAPERGEGPLTVRFWDVTTGRELGRLSGHASAVTALAFSPDGKRLVAGLWNGTALAWAVPAEARAAARAGAKLERKELDALWADLARDDARKSFAAVWTLAGSPDQSVPFLANALRPAGKIDAAKIRQQIADLGSEEFAVREEASRDLAAWGEDIEPELRKALAGQASPEVNQRIGLLLTALRNSPPPARRQELRGVWVLELIGTPASAKVLADLAKGDPDARLTREAKTALGRR